MIYYPLEILAGMSIREVLVVVGGQSVGCESGVGPYTLGKRVRDKLLIR